MTPEARSGLPIARILLSLLLAVAGVLAVRAFDIIPPTRIRIENTVSGGFDALPLLTKNLLQWEHALRFSVAGFTIAAVTGVWLARGFVWILTLSLVCAVLLLLVPPAIRFILNQAFVPVITPFEAA